MDQSIFKKAWWSTHYTEQYDPNSIMNEINAQCSIYYAQQMIYYICSVTITLNRTKASSTVKSSLIQPAVHFNELGDPEICAILLLLIHLLLSIDLSFTILRNFIQIGSSLFYWRMYSDHTYNYAWISL